MWLSWAMGAISNLPPTACADCAMQEEILGEQGQCVPPWLRSCSGRRLRLCRDAHSGCLGGGLLHYPLTRDLGMGFGSSLKASSGFNLI